MEAVTQSANGDAAVNALAAGADLALMPPDAAPRRTRSPRRSAMGRSSATTSSRSRDGSSRCDSRPRRSQDDPAASPADPEAVLTEVAEKSLTVLKGECEFAGTDAISIVGGGEKEKAALRRAAETAGLSVGRGGRR